MTSGAAAKDSMRWAGRCAAAGLLAFLATLAGLEIAGSAEDDTGAGITADGGNDLFVPPPPNSVRRFDTEGRTKAGTIVRLYESSAGAEEIARFYMAEMARMGWRYDEQMSRRIGEEIGGGGVFCFAGRRAVSIVNISEREDGRRAVWILTTRRTEAPPAPEQGEET